MKIVDLGFRRKKGVFEGRLLRRLLKSISNLSCRFQEWGLVYISREGGGLLRRFPQVYG